MMTWPCKTAMRSTVIYRFFISLGGDESLDGAQRHTLSGDPDTWMTEVFLTHTKTRRVHPNGFVTHLAFVSITNGKSAIVRAERGKHHVGTVRKIAPMTTA